MNTSNTEDIIDVRNVIERFEELETDLQDVQEASGDDRSFDDWVDWATENGEVLEAKFPNDAVATRASEFASLRELLGCLCSNGGDEQWRGDWYPITLIRDSHFESYAEQLADDIGAIDSNAGWPKNCIDWAKAAWELQMDYSSVEYDGATYWYQ